jgi:TatD DNase family protein
MYDIHCHLDKCISENTNFAKFEKPLKGLITSATQSADWEETIFLANKLYINVSLGIHPFFAEKEKNKITVLDELTKHQKVIALGEIGLDYTKEHISSKNIQKQVFTEQLNIAKKSRLPVIIHCRKAFDDLFAIIKEVDIDLPMIFHGFNGSENDLYKMNQFNSYYSFGPIILRENNKKQKKILTIIETNKLLLETDAPYMGILHPNDIIRVYQVASSCLEISLEELSIIIERNIKKIWKDFKEI